MSTRIPTRLVLDDREWCPPGIDQEWYGLRWLRVWAGRHGVVAVVTEILGGEGDTLGVSVMNAAEEHYAGVRVRFPSARVFGYFYKPRSEVGAPADHDFFEIRDDGGPLFPMHLSMDTMEEIVGPEIRVSPPVAVTHRPGPRG